MTANEPVTLCEYSAQWLELFEAEAHALQTAFMPSRGSVEHIGSTAVPGMEAKPIIDVLIGVESLAAVEMRIPALVNIGYRYIPEYETQLPERRFFVKPALGPALFHIHAVERGGAFWTDHLVFRGVLRRDPQLCAEYLALKRRLATSYATDRAGYPDAKAPFIRRAIDEYAPRAAARPGRRTS